MGRSSGRCRISVQAEIKRLRCGKLAALGGNGVALAGHFEFSEQREGGVEFFLLSRGSF
jgi:hypothetical protein